MTPTLGSPFGDAGLLGDADDVVAAVGAKDGELFKEVMRNQKKLRRDLKKAEQLFGKVKEDFDGYLNDNFSFSGVQL